MNIIDEAIAAVIGMMNAINPYATVTRGALPTGNSISCEASAYAGAEIYLDKGERIPVSLALNAKHIDLQTLTDTLNGIHDSLTKIRTSSSYPSGAGWKIVDIWTETFPRVLGREQDNRWMMASSIIINLEKKGV